MTYRIIILATLSLTLGGCIIVTDREDWEDTDGNNYSSWQREQRHNREAIDGLQLGNSVESVRTDMGRPEFTESFEREGHEYRVLRYRTHHRHSDGETTADETTPLVFENGQLVGWGDSALERLL